MTSILWLYFFVASIPNKQTRELVMVWYRLSLGIVIATLIGIGILDKLT